MSLVFVFSLFIRHVPIFISIFMLSIVVLTAEIPFTQPYFFSCPFFESHIIFRCFSLYYMNSFLYFLRHFSYFLFAKCPVLVLGVLNEIVFSKEYCWWGGGGSVIIFTNENYSRRVIRFIKMCFIAHPGSLVDFTLFSRSTTR